MGFSDWPTRLSQDATLAPAVRESHRWTLTRFLQFCRERQRGPALARADLGGPSWEQSLISGLRERHLAWRTEETYRAWLWRFAHWPDPPAVPEAGEAEVLSFLSHLAVEGRVGTVTQKQAINALVFYFREVERRNLGDFSDFVRARRRTRVPVVLSRGECERLFAALGGDAAIDGGIDVGERTAVDGAAVAAGQRCGPGAGTVECARRQRGRGPGDGAAGQLAGETAGAPGAA